MVHVEATNIYGLWHTLVVAVIRMCVSTVYVGDVSAVLCDRVELSGAGEW